MRNDNKIYPEKWLLMLSGTAFLLLIIPAWVSGFVWGSVWACAMCFVVAGLPVSRERVRSLLQRPGMAWISGFGCCGLACNFYNTWLDSSYVEKITSWLSMPPELFLLILCVLGVLAALPAVTCVLAWFWEKTASDLQEKKMGPDGKGISMCWAVLILWGIYAVGISAILRADFLYRDDFGRVAFGYKQWDYFSRYLSTALATLIHGGDYLVDIAPLPQLLAMGMLALAGVLLLYVVYDRTRFSGWELAALIPLGLNPYFLECVSYRFDAPYMAVSVLLGVLPLLFREKHPAGFLFASMMGVLGVCTSYQAATGVFPMLVIFLALRMLRRGETFKSVLMFCLRAATGFVLGLVFFKLVIMRPADAGYVTNALPPLKEILPHTLKNLKAYYSLIGSDFKSVWLLLAGIMALSFVSSAVSGWKGKKLAGFGLTVLALALMGALCFGIYPVLADTIFAPRAMYGFGVLLTIFAIAAAEGTGTTGKAAFAILAWLFFVFSFTYGNVLNAQKEYTDFRISLVLSDLNELEIFQQKEPVTVQLSGDIGLSPVIRNMPQNYGMLNRLMPKTFGAGEDWSQYGFYYYYDLPNVRWDRDVDLGTMNLPVLEDTMYHTIYGEGDCVRIQLK